MIYHTLADLLYNMKDDYGLSQEAVMNLPIRFSTGKGINNERVPSFGLLEKISDSLDCKVWELIKESEE